MAEYIERKKFIRKLNYICKTYGFSKVITEKFKNAINDSIAADVVEVKHGMWEKYANFSKIVNKYKCSLCGVEDIVLHHNYCPNCGAKMDLKEGAEE